MAEETLCAVAATATRITKAGVRSNPERASARKALSGLLGRWAATFETRKELHGIRMTVSLHETAKHAGSMAFLGIGTPTARTARAMA